MKVEQLMHSEARHVTPDTDLARAGRLMAEVGCGVLPVVDERQRVVGIVTDRDICLALARRDQRPSDIGVRQVMVREVHACAEGDDVRHALGTMARFKVRRLPILGPDGSLRGILSLDDIALHAHAGITGGFDEVLDNDVARTLGAICEHQLPALAG